MKKIMMVMNKNGNEENSEEEDENEDDSEEDDENQNKEENGEDEDQNEESSSEDEDCNKEDFQEHLTNYDSNDARQPLYDNTTLTTTAAICLIMHFALLNNLTD